MTDREKVIKGLELCEISCGNRCYETECPYYGQECTVNSVPYELMRDALALLKEQEPKTPIHIHEEYLEHDWETDENGNIDEWFMDYGFHNGPGCKRCGYSFCKHCKPNGWNEEPCVIDYYQCPKCGKHILKNGKNIEYCVNCGQVVKWDG